MCVVARTHKSADVIGLFWIGCSKIRNLIPDRGKIPEFHLATLNWGISIQKSCSTSALLRVLRDVHVTTHIYLHMAKELIW